MRAVPVGLSVLQLAPPERVNGLRPAVSVPAPFSFHSSSGMPAVHPVGTVALALPAWAASIAYG